MRIRLKKKTISSTRKVLLPIMVIIAMIMPFLLAEMVLRVTVGPYSTNGGTCVSSRLFYKYYDLNLKGLRDRDFSYEKGDNVFRILVLGDSVTFGQGIKDMKNTYPKLLEYGLKNISSKMKFEVINTGKRGMNTKMEFDFLKEEGIRYDPDLIILGYVFNDAEKEPLYAFDNPDTEQVYIFKDKDSAPIYGFREDDEEKIKEIVGTDKKLVYLNKDEDSRGSFLRQAYNYLYQNTYLFCLLRDHPAIYGLREKIRGNRIIGGLSKQDQFDFTNYTLDLYTENNFNRNKKELEEIINFSRENDVSMLIAIFPIWFGGYYDAYPYYHLHDYVRDIAENNSVEYVDIINYLKKLDPDTSLKVNAVDGHPNELAHKIAAFAILSNIIKEPGLLVPKTRKG